MSELKNSKLNLVKLPKSARKFVSEGDLKNDCVMLLRALSNLQELKDKKISRLIIYVCSLIENAKYETKDERLKLNKKQVAIDTLTSVFPDLNNDVDIKRLSELIDTICESKVIKKVATSKVISKGVVNFIKKKLL